jgi:hypothetical protein
MSEAHRYVIRRAFVIPLGLVLVLMAALLVVSLMHGQPVAKIAFLVVFAVPVTILFFASAFRSLTIDPTGVTARRPFRSKRIDFAAVTALESVRVRSRVFLTLCAGDDDFLIISNGYADFPTLFATLLASVPPTALSEETRQLAKAPPVRHADVVMAWFAVAALAYVLTAQFQG